jgi:hypothetical protein
MQNSKMTRLTEKYRFEKFFTAFVRQERGISKWDDNRTDQAVFVRRTLCKWFVGKAFQVIFDKFVPANGFMQIIPAHRIKYTKYILVTSICFTYAPYHDQITIYYAEPHSIKIEKIDLERNDWYDLSIEEDIESWTILRRFYPFEKTEIKLPHSIN